MVNKGKNIIKEYIDRELTEKRKCHTYRVAFEAVKLAKRYGADPQKAELAALCHDIVRDKPQYILDKYIYELNLDKIYIGNCNLAHAKVAAVIIKQDLGIEDCDIINAVSYHTTGRAGMSLLEKIIFIADAIESGRQYQGVDLLRKIAYKDLDLACMKALENTISYIESQGLYLDSDTVQAKYDLRKKKGE